MNLLILEAKRILKTKRTITIFIIIFLLSIITAYLPISFETYSHIDNNGNIIYSKGLNAIKYKKEAQSSINGDITPEKLYLTLKNYQSIVNKYGDPDNPNFPKDIYIKNILPVKPLLNLLMRTYEIELMDINIDDVKNFYDKNLETLKNKVSITNPYEDTKTKAIEMYNKVKKPFKYYSGYSSNSFDYILMFSFILVLLCTIIVAPTFSIEYSTGADNILRCTKNGRYRLALTKIIISFIISIMTYIIFMAIHLIILNFAFGGDAMKTSLQMLHSPVSLPSLTLGQTQIILVIGGLISLLAMISFTLYISAKCKTDSTSLLIGIIVCFLPILIYTIFDTNLISSILPTSGVALQSSLLYALTGWNFLTIGGISIWTPYIIIISAIIEIPVFLIMSIRAYYNHESI